MKLIARVKLQPTPEQHALLLQTLEAANTACNYVSQMAWQQRTFGQFALHHLCYKDIRINFGLGADITVRVIAKVADGYKVDRNTERSFKPHGAFPFNDRLVSYKLTKQSVSIWTMAGRQKMPFICGDHQAKLLEGLRGECDLIYRKDEWFLYQCCDVEDPPTQDVGDYLGVDLGIANIAVDSDHTVYQGKAMKSVRYRHRQLRRKLQAKGTKSARRRLKKLSGKERRFATNTNHVISKNIVAKAKDTGRGIAVEELTGIRTRVTARKLQRATLSSWSFHQLRQFIEYKSRLVGTPVIAVDPRNTSRQCPVCGYVSKANRKTQSSFSCIQCGFSGLADYIAALNIRGRALLSAPHVSDTGTNP